LNLVIKDVADVSFSGVSDADIQDIRDAIKSGKKTSLLCKIKATHAGYRNKNSFFYVPKAVRKAVPSWTTPYPKPVLLSHDDHSDPIGRVVSARWVRDVSREYEQEARKNNEPIGHIEVVARITDRDAIEKILDGRYLTVSQGLSAGYAKCSICGHDVIEARGVPCEHTRGRVYDGEVAYWEIGNITYNELSIVNKPADQWAVIVETEEVSDSKDSTTEDTLADNEIVDITLDTIIKDSASDRKGGEEMDNKEKENLDKEKGTEATESEDAKLSYAERKRLPDSAFCGPGRTFPVTTAGFTKRFVSNNSALSVKAKGVASYANAEWYVSRDNSHLETQESGPDNGSTIRMEDAGTDNMSSINAEGPVGARLIATCEYCGKEFSYYKSTSKGRFCSHECHRASVRKEKICEYCGKKFSPSSSRAKYCSPECFNKARAKRITLKCVVCGKTYQKRPSENKNGRSKCCSKACAAKLAFISSLRNKTVRTSGIERRFGDAMRDSGLNPFPQYFINPGSVCVDFAFPNKKLAVFVDGDFWHGHPSKWGKQGPYDAQISAMAKDLSDNKVLADMGWSIMRIWEHELNDSIEDAVERVREIVQA